MRDQILLKGLLAGFIALLCGLNSHLCSQQGSLLFHHLKQEDGLSQLTNQYVYKDTRGFVWISSIDGLNRFDGAAIKRYFPDLSDSTAMYGAIIQSPFFEDTLSRIWFSTYEAINCYDRKYDSFHPFFVKDSLNNREVGYHIFYLDSNNQLWIIVGDRNIYTLNVSSYEFKFIVSLKQDYQRAVSISNPDSKTHTVVTYTPNRKSIEEIEFDQAGKILNDQVLWDEGEESDIRPLDIITDSDSIVWIAGNDEMVKYNIITKSIRHIKVKNLLTIENFNDSLLLISIDDQGVWEFNKSTSAFGNQYVTENGNSLSLLTNTIKYMSLDQDHGIWLCSDGFGLSYAYPEKRKFNLCNPISIHDAENSKFSPNGFIPDSSNNVLCSTEEGGLFVLDRNCHIQKRITSTDKITQSRLNSIYEIFQDSRNHIWLSTYLGLSFIKGQYGAIHHVSDDTLGMFNGVELTDGRILFAGFAGGIYEAVPDKDTYKLNRIQGNKFNKIYIPIQQDRKGRIWINELLQKFIILDPTSFDSISELPIDGICSPLVESKDNQTIWVASTTGLYNVDAENLVICKAYKNGKGLPASGIKSMLMDDEGRLWLSCAKGLIVFDPKTDSSTVYSYDDGLPASTFNTYGAYKFSDGEMWFGSSSGITKFYPHQLRPIRIEAFPQITSLQINGKPPMHKLICEKTQSTNITEIQKLTFSYKENTLSFVLNALEYSAPSRNNIKYKMENFDADWEETASGSEVRYHLPQGSYSLLVRASNSDGVYSDKLRRLDITITPPFYKTWWFISLVALAILGLAVYIVYLNFSKKLELQKVRLRLYENLHDDVGSRLTAIVLSAEELIHQDNNVHPKLQHIAKVSKSIVNNMRRLVWAIDPENDSMNSMVQKIQYDKSLILDDKIEFNMEMDPQLKQMIVPGEIRYQVTSIVNEALNNISKYAKANHVWILLKKHNNELNLSIRDDGVGFNIEQTTNDKVRSSGYGLGNMQKRVSRVKGSIQIHSKPGEGTLIEVGIPI